MKYKLLLTTFLLSACSSQPRKPAADSPLSQTPPVQPVQIVEVPKDALSLEKALSQEPGLTVSFLRNHMKTASYSGIDGTDPAADLPASLKIDKTRRESDQNRAHLLGHLRRFKSWTLARKAHRAEQLVGEFQCSEAIEGQALGLSLERDFPATQAQELSESLHQKVIACGDTYKPESLFRLTVFSIQKGECPKALNYLSQFPPTSERGVNDRIAYLRGFCTASSEPIENRNPWGGYGIRLGEVKLTDPEKPVWFLSAQSGSEEWDRMLASFVELTEKGEKRKIKFIASQLNYEKLRSLPYPFQASMLVLLHFADADLTVFQTLHRYLADHPQLTTKEVVGLLFPVRYWKEIVENSRGVDPVLIKSLIRQESAFNPTAKSRARAYGLMQLIYATARIHGIRKPAQLLDPKNNIRVGSEFLAQLIDQFGSVELALAAYNAGPEVVKEWQKRYPTNNMDLFVEMIPYTETREYVRLINRNYRIYQNVLTDQIPQKPSLAENQALLP